MYLSATTWIKNVFEGWLYNRYFRLHGLKLLQLSRWVGLIFSDPRIVIILEHNLRSKENIAQGPLFNNQLVSEKTFSMQHCSLLSLSLESHGSWDPQRQEEWESTLFLRTCSFAGIFPLRESLMIWRYFQERQFFKTWCTSIQLFLFLKRYRLFEARLAHYFVDKDKQKYY